MMGLDVDFIGVGFEKWILVIWREGTDINGLADSLGFYAVLRQITTVGFECAPATFSQLGIIIILLSYLLWVCRWVLRCNGRVYHDD